MSDAALRFAPWHDKTHLSSAKYTSLTAAVSRVLFHVVDNDLDIGWARAFVRLYAQDAAAHALQVLDGEGGSNDPKPSPQELSIRKLTLQLAGRIARVKDGLGMSVLLDLAVAYGKRNANSLKTVFEEACKSTPSLLGELKMELMPAFRAALQDMEHGSLMTIRKATHVLSQLLHIIPHGFTPFPFSEDQEFVLVLSRCYQVGLDNLAASRGGIRFESMETSTEWQRDWLYSKVGLLDSFHAIIEALLQSTLPEDENRLFDILFEVLGLPSSSTSPPSPSTPFISQSLLADYQYAFNFSSVLSERFRGNDDARVDLLATTLVNLAPSSHKSPKPSGGLSIILKDNHSVHKAVPTSHSKEKSTAIIQDPQHEAMLDLAVSEVLDIFPTHTPQHIRHCLEHPTFSGDPEKLISSLLEGTLPPELTGEVNVISKSVSPLEEFEFIKYRRNAWDDDPMDFSRLSVGKIGDNADSLLQDRSFVEHMKADIIRRAQEISDDEDKSIKSLRKRTVAFEEELDDETESLVNKGVKVTGDGEASDESDGDGDAGDLAGPQMSSPGNVLELAYLEDPKLFDRDGATRRSKLRTELKAKTGWSDEQIEGWRIMLERNPKKDQILQKFEFAGNVPLASNRHSNEAGPSASSGGETSQRGRGRYGRGNGRGAGRGSGRGSGGDTARGRMWKDKNKAMSANHNRKRGHDKKMARGDTGPPR